MNKPPLPAVDREKVTLQRGFNETFPERMRASVHTAMNQAYATRDPKRARRLLENLARRLESAHPGAAASCARGWRKPLP